MFEKEEFYNYSERAQKKKSKNTKQTNKKKNPWKKHTSYKLRKTSLSSHFFHVNSFTGDIYCFPRLIQSCSCSFFFFLES
mmetsp:Transcript_5517/g.8611  ORF Transcript_5517/g.8611 Transcript_5517/m.8611 type:complete len:80 (+) Transcript_5517:189-428(+)